MLVEDLAGLLQSSGVEWLGLAGTLLGIAAGIARQQRRSAASQGARIGALESQVTQERIRRQQIEAVLTGEGLPLPFWPPDGAPRPQWRRPVARVDTPPPADYPDVDQADEPEQPRTPPPVPPLDPAIAARHRRPASL
jgi:hypothetical protein